MRSLLGQVAQRLRPSHPASVRQSCREAQLLRATPCSRQPASIGAPSETSPACSQRRVILVFLNAAAVLIVADRQVRALGLQLPPCIHLTLTLSPCCPRHEPGLQLRSLLRLPGQFRVMMSGKRHDYMRCNFIQHNETDNPHVLPFVFKLQIFARRNLYRLACLNGLTGTACKSTAPRRVTTRHTRSWQRHVWLQPPSCKSTNHRNPTCAHHAN